MTSKFVAGGSGTNVLAYSSDAKTWTNSVNGNAIFTATCTAVAWNGTLWVAGGSGVAHTLASSVDGQTWTGRGNAIFTATCTAVAWNGTLWVAGGSGNNTLASSVDGQTWTGRGNAIFTVNCTAVAWNGTLWVAGGSGTNTLASSVDGQTWTGRGIAIFTATCTAVAWNGTLWVAGGSGVAHTLASSVDGQTWTGRGNLIFTATCTAVAWNGTLWVAGGSGGNTLAYSSDGITWVGLGTAIFSNNCFSISWNGSVFVAGGNATDSGLLTHTIAYSTDGITWIPDNLITANATFATNCRALAYSITIPNSNVCKIGYPTDSSYIKSFVRYYSSTLTPIFATTQITGIVLRVVPNNGSAETYIIQNSSTQQQQKDMIILNTQFITTANPIPIGYCVEVLPYSRDNFSPFVYNGSLTSQNQPVSYEVSLNSLTVPNVVLSSGGRIAYYPYVYVELENVGTTSNNTNTIYSNNPNTYKAIFKVPITDLNNPATTPFVKLTGNNVVQTIPFKINSDMRVSVKVPDGRVFTPLLADNGAGQAPDPMLQLSVLFEVNRI